MGHTEIMEYADANERYDIEQYVEAPFFDDAEVRVHTEHAHIDGDFDISEMGNCLFLKDLTVTGNILNSSDGDGPVFLIVLGSCTAKNVFVDEPLICVQQNLTVEGGVLANYNHGLLRIRGDVVATVLCAEHEVLVSGAVRCVSVDRGGLHVRDESFTPTLSQLTQNEVGRYFVDSVLADGELNVQALQEALEAGVQVLKTA